MRNLFLKPGVIMAGNVVMAIIAFLLILVLFTDNSVGAVNLPPGTTTDRAAVAAFELATATPQPTPTPAATATPEPTATAVVSTEPPTPQPPTPTPLPPIDAIIPIRVRIPTIGVDTTVEQVGKTSDGAMDVPKSYWTVGWYKLGAKPGEIGSAVLAGHLDNPKGPAIFWDLKKLQPGSKIFVSDNKGKEKVFEVYENEVYPYDKAPLERIFGANDGFNLNLITCGGVFDQKSQNYDKRLVVYARLLQNQ